MYNMRLQKLLYLAHGYHLAVLDEPLINDVFDATMWGPLCYTLHDEISFFGRRNVIIDGYDLELPEVSGLLVCKVVDLYRDARDGQIDTLIRDRTGPWAKTYNSRLSIIEDVDIKDFFVNRLDLIK